MTAEHDDSRDERIGRILNEYLDRKQKGEPVSEQDMLNAHPDLADELREHFAMVYQVAAAPSHGAQNTGRLTALPHDALPGYELLGEIHRGGQGVIYQAVQKSTRRQVAIKVMREGPFASWRDRARFEREVRILAALKHPSIVTIHDSGTAAHCQFFVMDYIAGTPLDAWQNAAPRSVEQSLQLFVSICEAVNAAHVKGIIHRDLKPGNIRIDDEGRPHILDFGLAKVAGSDDDDDPAGRITPVVMAPSVDDPASIGPNDSATANTSAGMAAPANMTGVDMTLVGQFVGSLPWTSPEQAQGMLDQIDTRTDVYALGVILYQMLTGKFPYNVVGPMRDVLNRIVSDEPPPASTLRPGLGRDVDAIVLKCLRKEPARRYQTAGELARDIERYLHSEPIAARSDSGLYVLRKMLRRHRVPVAVAAAFAALVGVSLILSVSLWRQAVIERDRAVAAESDQQLQRRRADAQAAEAEQARKLAELERTRTQEQAERLRRTTYFSRIALAQNAWEQRYITQAQYMLDACPADLRGWEWFYLSRLTHQSPLLDVGADSRCVVALAVSPDGQRIITGGCDGPIRIWDAATGGALATWQGHTGQVNTLAFSPDGRWIASGGRDKTLRLWDAHAGVPRVLQEKLQYVNSVAFSPDSSRLVAGGQSRDLTFFDVVTGQLVRTVPTQQGETSCVAWSPDGRHVVTGEFLDLFREKSRVTFWEAATGAKVREIEAHSASILSLAISPDGSRIASGSSIPPTSREALGTLKVFNAATGKELLSLRGHEGFVEALAFSFDGALLASAGMPRIPAFGMQADRTVKVWNTATGAEWCTYSAHSGGGRAVAWSLDATRVFSGGTDGHLKAWPSSPSPEARIIRGHEGPVLRVAFSPDGRRIASCSGQGAIGRAAGPNNTVRIWDQQSGAQIKVLTGHSGAVLALDWSRDGKYLASGSVDRSVRLWDAASGEQALALASREGAVQSVAFSPDSTLLAAAAENTVTLWRIPDGSESGQFQHADALRSVAFSPDGRWLAAAAVSGEVHLWDRTSDNALHSIRTGEPLNGAWFSPDSTVLATAHASGTIALWKVPTGEKVAAMTGPQRSVQWLDFSPDGQRIASCATDMLLKIWDVRSASEVYSIRAHDAPVLCVKFSPDGADIATCSEDGVIKIWETGQQEDR